MSKISLEGENWNVKCEKIIFNSQFSILNFLTWRITDSNRWPPACKAGALASWANPPFHRTEPSCSPRRRCCSGHIALRLSVVPGRLELPTSTLSVWRSNQLSYRTVQSCRIYESYNTINSCEYKRLRLTDCIPKLLFLVSSVPSYLSFSM